ncbi:hypothetical protein AYR66_17995 [Noviherbaspirillum denitrificans]|uniref:Uncharacterized protein n=1 Tax=Noviherbaspirillum denitrificans TaxID=1968433 RepID=A0A254TEK5_9BURK|nr:hypothetical protein AYR66_17995 [Noviherbaspirillum denitrificans]
MCRQHVALATETGTLFADESTLCQRLAHSRRDGIGGNGGIRRGDPVQPCEHLRRPHLGILAGREAVQVEGIRGGIDLRQAVGNVAECQCQDHAARVQLDPVEPGNQYRPCVAQCG